MGKITRKVKFCWLCDKKLRGSFSEELIIDEHPRTLHKICAKEVKRDLLEGVEYIIL
jgi:hypothetical protein